MKAGEDLIDRFDAAFHDRRHLAARPLLEVS